jgi:spore germination protein KB
MIENGKISVLQFGILVFMFSFGSAGLLIPSIIVSIAKQDAWITIPLCMIVMISFISLWNRLSLKYPNESIIQYSDRILGKWLGKMVGILYLCYFLYLSAFVLRELGGFITTNVLILTPMQFVHIIFMLPVLYGVFLGLEVIARASEILFPWIIMFISTTLFLLLKDINLSELLPILPNGWQTPVKAMYPVLGFPISEVVVFLMIFPFVAQPNQIKKYFNFFFILSALIASFVVILTISVLGVDITARSTYSVFDLAKEIKVGNFLSRVEVLIGGFWIMTIFIKLAVFFYAANLAAAHLFKLKSYRVTIIPFGLLVIALSMLVYKNPADFIWFLTGAYPIYGLFHGIVIPALLLVITKIRRIN